MSYRHLCRCVAYISLYNIMYLPSMSSPIAAQIKSFSCRAKAKISEENAVSIQLNRETLRMAEIRSIILTYRIWFSEHLALESTVGQNVSALSPNIPFQIADCKLRRLRLQRLCLVIAAARWLRWWHWRNRIEISLSRVPPISNFSIARNWRHTLAASWVLSWMNECLPLEAAAVWLRST